MATLTSILAAIQAIPKLLTFLENVGNFIRENKYEELLDDTNKFFEEELKGLKTREERVAAMLKLRRLFRRS